MSYIWQLLTAAVFLAAHGTYVWRRWGMPGAGLLVVGCLFLIWVGFSLDANGALLQLAISAWILITSGWLLIPVSVALLSWLFIGSPEVVVTIQVQKDGGSPNRCSAEKEKTACASS